MKKRNFLLLFLTVLLAVSLVACGEENIFGTNDSTDTGDVQVTDSTVTDTAATPVSIVLGENHIEKYRIVFSSDDAVGKNISDYISEKIRAITGKDITRAESTEGLEYAIVIGENLIPEADLEVSDFIIKFLGNNLYISYTKGAGAFPAVSTVLEDSLFASHNRVDDTYTLASNLEFFGMCDDYVIGDNEFNPFE